jgi:SWI/SNF-related matrix-associated actin-dependent regulator 1 of chromatin subfamily A
MSLLCFLMPLFTRESSGYDEGQANGGCARMLEHFVRLERSGEHKDSIVSEDDAYRKLKQLLAPFVLRRKKDEVLSQIIPPKVSFVSIQRIL